LAHGIFISHACHFFDITACLVVAIFFNSSAISIPVSPARRIADFCRSNRRSTNYFPGTPLNQSSERRSINYFPDTPPNQGSERRSTNYFPDTPPNQGSERGGTDHSCTRRGANHLWRSTNNMGWCPVFVCLYDRL
jgi:hypothetical protein